MKIFEISDTDWWLANTLAEAIADAAKLYDLPEDEVSNSDACEVPDADFDRLMFDTGEYPQSPLQRRNALSSLTNHQPSHAKRSSGHSANNLLSNSPGTPRRRACSPAPNTKTGAETVNKEQTQGGNGWHEGQWFKLPNLPAETTAAWYVEGGKVTFTRFDIVVHSTDYPTIPAFEAAIASGELVPVEDSAAAKPATTGVCRCGLPLIKSGDTDADPWCSGCNMSAATCDCCPAGAKEILPPGYSPRLLANRYLELPYLLRLEIAKELSLVESGDEKLEELERGKRVFERAVAAKKVLQLWHAVNARRGEIEDDEPAPTKGDYGGNCNRSACERRDATYFNASTRKFYCSRCAAAINDANKDYLAAHGVPLCTPGPAEAKYLPLPASPPVESSQGVTGEEIAELRKLEKAASPAPWEADTTDSDGTYGSGDDTHEGFDAREMIGPNGHVLFDSLNSGTAEIHTDTDEDSYRAWDEVARRNFDFVAAFRNAAPRLLATLESQSRRIAELECVVAKLPKDKNGNPIAVGMYALATGHDMGGDCEANEQPYKVVSVCCDHVWLSQQLDEQDCFHASQCVVFDSLAAALASRTGTGEDNDNENAKTKAGE